MAASKLPLTLREPLSTSGHVVMFWGRTLRALEALPLGERPKGPALRSYAFDDGRQPALVLQLPGRFSTWRGGAPRA